MSVTTLLELLSAWRSTEKLVWIGDDCQLEPLVFTGPMENPFHRTMEYSPFARFRDLYVPDFLLNEQMRMPAGMMHLSNDVIYGGRLKDVVILRKRKLRLVLAYARTMTLKTTVYSSRITPNPGQDPSLR